MNIYYIYCIILFKYIILLYLNCLYSMNILLSLIYTYTSINITKYIIDINYMNFRYSCNIYFIFFFTTFWTILCSFIYNYYINIKLVSYIKLINQSITLLSILITIILSIITLINHSIFKFIITINIYIILLFYQYFHLVSIILFMYNIYYLLFIVSLYYLYYSTYYSFDFTTLCLLMFLFSIFNYIILFSIIFISLLLLSITAFLYIMHIL